MIFYHYWEKHDWTNGKLSFEYASYKTTIFFWMFSILWQLDDIAENGIR